MKRRFPMNFQLFAEGGASGGQGDGAGASGAAGNQPDVGVNAKTIPYLIKMTDFGQAVGQDGKNNEETVSNALKKTLEDVPGLKPAQNSQGGFVQMGASGSGNQTQTNDAALKAASGIK